MADDWIMVLVAFIMEENWKQFFGARKLYAFVFVKLGRITVCFVGKGDLHTAVYETSNRSAEYEYISKDV